MSARARILTLLTLLLGGLLPGLSVPAAAQEAAPTPAVSQQPPPPSRDSVPKGDFCDGIQDALRKALCQAGTGLLADGPAAAITEGTASLASSAFDAVAKAFADAAASLLAKLADFITATTQLDLAAPWFLKRYSIMLGLSAVVTLVLALLAVIKGVVRGRPGDVVQAVTGYFLAAVALGAFAPALVWLLLDLSDGATAVLSQGMAEDAHRFLVGTGKAVVALGGVGGPGATAMTLVMALFVILAAAVLWGELAIRTAAIYVGVLFAAPTFTGLVDRAWWPHVRRYVYFLLAVVFAKPVIVAVLALAAAGAGNGGTADAMSSVFTGLALMVVAIFAAGLLFKLIPQIGAQLEGAAHARRELVAAIPSQRFVAPATLLRQGISTHMIRGSAGPAGEGGGAASTRVHMAHAAPADGASAGGKPRQPDDKGGPNGGVPARPA